MGTIIGFTAFVIIGIIVVSKLAMPKTKGFDSQQEFQARLLSSTKAITNSYSKL